MDQQSFDVWIAEANNDVLSGQTLCGIQIYNSAVFHFVQATEKALKALLYFLNIPSWGHSSMELLDNCESMNIEIPDVIKENAKILGQHYNTSRYPDVTP